MMELKKFPEGKIANIIGNKKKYPSGKKTVHVL
jgi:hypothetical protein